MEDSVVVAPPGGENTATEYDLIKEALLSNPRDYTHDITLEELIKKELGPVTEHLSGNKEQHLSYGDASNLIKSSKINITGDRGNSNLILTRNTNHENEEENLVPNAEFKAGWLQTKLAHLDSLDKVTDWLRALGAPGFKLNDRYKSGNRIEDEGGH